MKDMDEKDVKDMDEKDRKNMDEKNMKDIELRRQLLETYRSQVGVNSVTALVLTLMLLIAAVGVLVINPNAWMYSLMPGGLVILLGIINYRYVKKAEKAMKRFTKELLEAEQALKDSESKRENDEDQHE